VPLWPRVITPLLASSQYASSLKLRQNNENNRGQNLTALVLVTIENINKLFQVINDNINKLYFLILNNNFNPILIYFS